jgi:uncharacterized membrane protein (DUF4010 family)
VVGLVDVDSVTIAMVRLPTNTLSIAGAAYAILAAVASDTVDKVAIGAVIGDRSPVEFASGRRLTRRE